MHGAEVIPAEAVEAAYEALPLDSYIAGTDHVRAMLEAAAPFITAAAYEADELAAEYRRGYRDGLADRKQVTAGPREWEPGDPVE